MIKDYVTKNQWFSVTVKNRADKNRKTRVESESDNEEPLKMKGKGVAHRHGNSKVIGNG